LGEKEWIQEAKRMNGAISRVHQPYLHGRTAIVFFNEPAVSTLGHVDGFGKSLFLKVANGIVVGVRYKVLDTSLCSSLLEEIH
jgi:hypothetical protein